MGHEPAVGVSDQVNLCGVDGIGIGKDCDQVGQISDIIFTGGEGKALTTASIGGIPIAYSSEGREAVGVTVDVPPIVRLLGQFKEALHRVAIPGSAMEEEQEWSRFSGNIIIGNLNRHRTAPCIHGFNNLCPCVRGESRHAEHQQKQRVE